MSGTGRRRKPSPGDEGYVQPPPDGNGPSATGPGAAPQPDRSAEFSYDWRQPAQQPQPSPAQPYEPQSYSSGSYAAPSYGAAPTAPSYGSPTADRGTDSGMDSSAGGGSRGYGAPRSDGRFPGQATQPPAPAASSDGTAGRQAAPGPVFGGYTPTPDPLGYRLPDPYSPSAYQSAPPDTAQAASAPAAPPITPQAGRRGPAAPGRGPSAAEPTGLFDDDDLFGDSGPGRSGSYQAAPAAAPPTPRAPGRDAPRTDPDDLFGLDESQAQAPRPAALADYSPTDFGFVDEDSGSNDVEHWLTFAETRADTRAERAKRFRRRVIAGAGVLALVAAGFGAYVLLAGNPLAPVPSATKSVIMFQLRDTSGNAVGDALLITDDSSLGGKTTGRGSAVLVPSQLVVNTIAFGDQSFGGDMTANPPVLPAQADTVSDLLGVTIDGVWGMDETTFAAMVDEMNGLPVTTTVAVPAQGNAPAVPLGSETLSGAQSVAYLTYAPKGEAPDAQVDRFGQVVTALLKTLPNESVVINGYLNHLGIVNDPSLPNSKLTPILAALASEEQAGRFTVDPLPMRTDGSDELNYQAAGPIVANLLGGALKSGSAAGQLPRVLVEDAAGADSQDSTGLRNAAEAALANAGYTAADGGTVSGVQATTVIEVPNSDGEAAAQQVAATLGLPTSDVKVVNGLSAVADVTVVLGADWAKLAQQGQGQSQGQG